MSAIEPKCVYDVRDIDAPYWLLMRGTGHVLPIPVFACFKSARDLMKWYEDGCQDYGERGASFSKQIIAWSRPYEEIAEEVDEEVFE